MISFFFWYIKNFKKQKTKNLNLKIKELKTKNQKFKI